MHISIQRRALSPVIAYTEMGNKNGTPLVYIHGWGCSKQDFASAAKNKRLQQYRLIAFDFPGCGESSYAGKLTADDMVAITHRLLVDLKASPVVLVGHSMGGALAIRYAERFPTEALGIVSVAGNMIAEDCKLTRKVAGETKKNLQKDYGTWVATMKSNKNPGWRAYGQTLEKWTNPKAYHDYARLAVRLCDRGGLLPLFSRLPMPKLFLYCQNDQSSPQKLQALSNNGVETKAIPRSQHFPGYDNPTYYYRVLADFMTKVTSGQQRHYSSLE